MIRSNAIGVDPPPSSVSSVVYSALVGQQTSTLYMRNHVVWALEHYKNNKAQIDALLKSRGVWQRIYPGAYSFRCTCGGQQTMYSAAIPALIAAYMEPFSSIHKRLRLPTLGTPAEATRFASYMRTFFELAVSYNRITRNTLYRPMLPKRVSLPKRVPVSDAMLLSRMEEMEAASALVAIRRIQLARQSSGSRKRRRQSGVIDLTNT